MKKLSIITILMFSMGFASTSFSAGKTVDDYLGYSDRMNNPVDQIRHGRDTDDSSRNVHSRNNQTTAIVTPRGEQNIDDRESRRIGKLLWKNDHVQGGHGNVK
ncbi:MAG: hypothetical protein K2P74_04315 [Nitrosomonas sp.]|nr:hypothetical protein [Nitrosomonas sp.]